MLTKTYVGGVKKGAANASISTAYGVYTAIMAAARYRFDAENLHGVKIAVQGLGNVGLRMVKYLKDAGAEIYATDIHIQQQANACEELGIHIANGGGIIDLHYQFSDNEHALKDHLDSIAETLLNIFEVSNERGLPTSEVADQLAEQRIYEAKQSHN